MFDPIERSKQVEEIVMRNFARRYYRFRYARFYGGIVTADAIGCNLLCVQCWNYERNENPAVGTFLTPKEAAKKIVALCIKNDQWHVRMSGCEPILGERSAKHFKALMDACDEISLDLEKPDRCNFILETNGLMLGYMPELINMLTGNYMTVRISFKGHNPEVFEGVTGAKGEYWKYPLKAFKACKTAGIQVVPACMPAFSDKAILEALIGQKIEDIERLRAYPKTSQRMKERGVHCGW